MTLDTARDLCSKLRKLAAEPSTRGTYALLFHQVLQGVLHAVVMGEKKNREIAGEFLTMIRDVERMDHERKAG